MFLKQTPSTALGHAVFEFVVTVFCLWAAHATYQGVERAGGDEEQRTLVTALTLLAVVFAGVAFAFFLRSFRAWRRGRASSCPDVP